MTQRLDVESPAGRWRAARGACSRRPLAFPAAVEAQREVRSATLTPRTIGGSLVGCAQGFAGALCTDANNLSDPNSDHGSTNYEFEQFNLDTSSGILTVVFDDPLATDTNPLVLVVGDSSFQFDDRDFSTDRSRGWRATGLT